MCSIAAKLLINSINTNPVCKLVFVNSSEAKRNDRQMAKCYFRHTGYPGGIKRKLASTFGRENFILQVLRKMLPRTKCFRSLLSRVVFVSNIKSLTSSAKLRFISVNN
ncbi:MAG: hypothetical protein ACEY26_00660 [Candidatus Hodgkinia cicadicola]